MTQSLETTRAIALAVEIAHEEAAEHGVTIDATTEQTIRAASWDAVRALWADGAKPNKETTWDAAVETAIALVQDLADEA
jgi:hypothetical protein